MKSLESVVRELVTTVTTLSSKVGALEAKIEAQNSLIIKLTSDAPVMNKAPLPTARNSLTPVVSSLATPPTAAAAMHRPARAARSNAVFKINGGYSGAAKNTTKKTVSAKITTETAIPLTPAVAATEPVIDAQVPPPAKLLAEIITPTTTDDLTDQTQLNNDGNWTKVVSRRPINKRRNNRVTTGTGCEDSELQTVDRLKFIQTWELRPETTEDGLRKFLNKIVASEKYSVEKRILKTDTQAAFVVGIPESIFERVTSPTAWPPRVKFASWFPVRPRRQRGEHLVDINTATMH